MKIILSRKGFDSEFGGYPSPIFPIGLLISFTFPAIGRWVSFNYSELSFGY
jgi:hypothetical protein